jgi:single-strand DNA-binding protein
MNNVSLIGRLSKTPELRYSNTGTAVTTFTVAVNRFGKDEADFINCVAFKKSAEALANYTDKGSLIGLTGSIQVRSYEKDGSKRWVTEVIANSVQFLDSKKKEDKPAPAPKQNKSFSMTGLSTDDDPFNGKGSIDISSDDLPF